MFQNRTWMVKMCATVLIFFLCIQCFVYLTSTVKVIKKQPPFVYTNRIDACTSFKFDPVDWTLYEKAPYKETNESARCQYLHDSIFKGMYIPLKFSDPFNLGLFSSSSCVIIYIAPLNTLSDYRM